MKSFIAQTSQSLFRLAHVLEDWVGLPNKVSESLYFRRAWRKYLNSGIRYASPSLWIHGASVGELENLANFFLSPDYVRLAGYATERLVLTASSVSAKEFLENLQKRQAFRYCGPIPPEDVAECRNFLDILNPDLLVMSHTDIWPCLLREAKTSLRRGCLWLPKKIPQDRLLEKEILYPLVKKVGLGRSSYLAPGPYAAVYVGNPRLDRVYQRISQASPFHPLLALDGAPKAGQLNVIIGSCWSDDALVWARAYEKLSHEERQKIFLVAIPHDITDTVEVAKIQSLLPWARVITVSGVLLEAYQNFDLAFVGGGYHRGLHSIVEPALWALPVLCGPETENQGECSRLAELGSLQIIANSEILEQSLRRLFVETEMTALKTLARLAKEVLLSDLGATRRLVNLIKEENP